MPFSLPAALSPTKKKQQEVQSGSDSDHDGPASPSKVVMTPEISALLQAAWAPAPPKQFMRCILHRMGTKDKTLFPSFILMSEDGSLSLAARLRKKTATRKYLISVDKTTVQRGTASVICSLRASLMGNEWQMKDISAFPIHPGRSLGCIVSDTNCRPHAAFPKDTAGSPFDCPESLVNAMRNGHHSALNVLRPKPGNLMCIGRPGVQQSVKNTQMVFGLEGDPSAELVFQLLKVGEDQFALDFRPPLCAIHALAIALTRF
eukprot:NODE_4951_length_997_cov_145.362700_g4744_i0.p1 GENE.NODE_4951_length_997_cov_145.362700_g4744_i0~~NODE_4951_length_997_cov_145.362700_g4744_i0.p1  ORF type:complete len:261 (+),score=31.76 NODE_4951_length_997_cov_145.362700_g4744_i0:90-872(+)